MKTILFRTVRIALCALTLATPSWADSGASSASSAGSASVGSLSNSITASSNSSSPADKVAEGDYRVVEVVALADRPGLLRVQLLAVAGATEAAPIWLTLPEKAMAGRGLRNGDIVNARHRPYGIEFAHAEEAGRPRTAFFLVLADEWFDELAPKVLTL